MPSTTHFDHHSWVAYNDLPTTHYGYEKTVFPALKFWGLSGICLKFLIESGYCNFWQEVHGGYRLALNEDYWQKCSVWCYAGMPTDFGNLFSVLNRGLKFFKSPEKFYR